jgi:hypothetical protein
MRFREEYKVPLGGFRGEVKVKVEVEIKIKVNK